MTDKIFNRIQIERWGQEMSINFCSTAFVNCNFMSSIPLMFLFIGHQDETTNNVVRKYRKGEIKKIRYPQKSGGK